MVHYFIYFIFLNENTATIKTNSLILNEEMKLLLTKVALLDHSVLHYLTIQAQGELLARCRNARARS